MRAQGGGTIVNISSINSTVGFPMRLAYSAAKAAVNAITQGLAIEWAGYSIRVNGIAPGVTDTPMVREAITDGFIDLPAYLQRTPLGRLGRPDDIAQVALFLATARSSFLTGQTIVADGGWSAFGFIPWAGDPEATAR
jgi:NAD(P)-dependent dehydrogenase (short-subunit alcohol dehydrogenase family)